MPSFWPLLQLRTSGGCLALHCLITVRQHTITWAILQLHFRVIFKMLAEPSTSADSLMNIAAERTGISKYDLRMVSDGGRRLNPDETLDRCDLDKWFEICMFTAQGGQDGPCGYAKLTASGMPTNLMFC